MCPNSAKAGAPPAAGCRGGRSEPAGSFCLPSLRHEYCGVSTDVQGRGICVPSNAGRRAAAHRCLLHRWVLWRREPSEPSWKQRRARDAMRRPLEGAPRAARPRAEIAAGDGGSTGATWRVGHQHWASASAITHAGSSRVAVRKTATRLQRMRLCARCCACVIWRDARHWHWQPLAPAAAPRALMHRVSALGRGL